MPFSAATLSLRCLPTVIAALGVALVPGGRPLFLGGAAAATASFSLPPPPPPPPPAPAAAAFSPPFFTYMPNTAIQQLYAG